ncbi:MAG: transcriptional regulator GcvA [Alphaproteobacteria bacterium]|jgi:LysR family transcriptional regulator, glycine cleavage system transcriptional activator|nr:transcriptional regulator GcvA [Rhodospirillaceae bacterium]MBT6512479.1 transcriptional regulator GcvA [Rhodospirillaceae bacterium]MBT7613838.1 transcriptional regulator GcvA [Rhodospirillaceae bacterium]MBT7648377.1 transcriptional regulator GcvA [Rhodospirillaceae bacterium]MDG2480979.1 transcriptional regulator GcvA [Alphaproteobacteria bacterium]
MDTRLSTLPLNSLRAFEAAARRLSFTEASDELAVTPAAISHQIRGLEDRLGMRLFERRTRAVALTEAGKLILPEVSQAFATMQRALARLERLHDDQHITVTLSPSLAARWLLPRLDRFQQHAPEIELRISASDELVDLALGEVDAAMRFGRGNYPGMQVDKLADVELFPVCAPLLASPDRPLDKPSDLARHNLLHDDSWSNASGVTPGWDMWLKTLGVQGVDLRRGDHFSDAGVIVQAAILGRGVALASHDMADQALENRQLIRPFEGNDAVALEFGIYFVCPPEALQRPQVAALRNWVLEEFKRDGQVATPDGASTAPGTSQT